MLEEVEVGVHSGPHTGWGGWLPLHCPPCTLPVPGLGVRSWGLPVTGCPLGIDSVTESLLDMGSPGVTGVSLLGLEDNPAQSHALDKRPRGQPQSPHDPQMASYRWGSCLPWGWGGTHRDPSLEQQKCAPLLPRLGATPGFSCPFSLPKKPSTAPASLGRGLRPLTHQRMLVPPTQRRSEPGLGRGLETGAGDRSASRRRAGQRGLARSGVRSLELGLEIS